MNNFLFDSSQNKYLARLKNSKEDGFLIREKEQSFLSEFF